MKVLKPVNLRKYKFANDKDGNIELVDAYLKFTDPNPDILVNGGREYGEKIINNLSAFKNYGKTRNNLDQHTTLLSAYLKYGNVSVRETYDKMVSKLGKRSDLLRQLIWREFYAQLLFSNPQVLGNPLKPKYDKINLGFKYFAFKCMEKRINWIPYC